LIKGEITAPAVVEDNALGFEHPLLQIGLSRMNLAG
jgi:hypothetical protein